MPQNTTERRYDNEQRCYELACEDYPGHVGRDEVALARRITACDTLLKHAAPLETRVLELEEELRRMREAGKWISVEQNLPKRGAVVIACHQPSGGVFPARTSGLFGPDEPEIEWIDPLGGVRNVTHWQFLPTPPQVVPTT